MKDGADEFLLSTSRCGSGWRVVFGGLDYGSAITEVVMKSVVMDSDWLMI
jgi:hypothetical protein